MEDGLVIDEVALDEFFNDSEGPVGQELDKVGQSAVGIAQSLAPVSSLPQDVEGELRDSIRYVVLENEPGVMIGTDVPYALYVEFGTFDMGAQPFLRPVLDMVQP